MKLIAWMAVAYAVAIATVTPVSATKWSAPDGNGHPDVVILIFIQNGEGHYSCTGTLLTPHVVLTAGHCTEGAGQANDFTWVRNDADIDAASAILKGFSESRGRPELF